MGISNEGFSNEMKQVEKIHYKGDLRIIGQIVNTLHDKEPIGYVIMTEKTRQFKMYTVPQTMSLVAKFKFVNAELQNGKLVNTECAMDRLPKFDRGMRVIGNFGILILGEIIEKDRTAGYRVMDSHGRVVDLLESELLVYSRTTPILNAKIVTRNDKMIISAIKSEFTKIEKSQAIQMCGKKAKTAAWIREKHNTKWLNTILPGILYYYIIGNKGEIINDRGFARTSDGYSYIDIDREIRIMSKELFTPKYGINLSENDQRIIKELMTLPRKGLIGRRVRGAGYEQFDDSTRIVMTFMAQFVLNNPENVKNIQKFISSHARRGTAFGFKYQSLIESKEFKRFAGAKLKSLVDWIEKYRANYLKSGSLYNSGEDARAFKTTKFCTAEDIAQLGFTINKADSGVKYTTKTNFHKTLLYLGDIIGIGYDDYKKASRCLGDLISIAYIKKLLANPNYCAHIMDRAVVIEVLITLAYMFNSKAMKLFVYCNEDAIRAEGVEIPNFDDLANVDYQLPREITLYYTSGYNVFLKDNYSYTKRHLVNANIINYRQLGVSHIINHPLLNDDLVGTLAMVTSDNCSVEELQNVVGKLRFL